jgi:uncharacterized membrane protein
MPTFIEILISIERFLQFRCNTTFARMFDHAPAEQLQQELKRFKCQDNRLEMNLPASQALP